MRSPVAAQQPPDAGGKHEQHDRGDGVQVDGVGHRHCDEGGEDQRRTGPPSVCRQEHEPRIAHRISSARLESAEQDTRWPGRVNWTLVEARDWPEISVRRVSPGYFRALHVPLVRGRLLTDTDDAQAAPALLINEETVRRFFSRQDPIGQRIFLYGAPRTIASSA